MTSAEQKCKDLCRELVMLRAGDRCELCGSPYDLHQHHGLFLSDQRLELNPALKYDPDLQFCLCGQCHQCSTDSPHVNNKLFLLEMTRKGGIKMVKAYKIIEAKRGKLIIVQDREIDYGEIASRLDRRIRSFREEPIIHRGHSDVKAGKLRRSDGVHGHCCESKQLMDDLNKMGGE